jgi:hypothetical protein
MNGLVHCVLVPLLLYDFPTVVGMQYSACTQDQLDERNSHNSTAAVLQQLLLGQICLLEHGVTP